MFDLLKKTDLGVKRSKETWFGKIANVFNRSSFGDEVWEELEELLVSSDVGVETTSKLLSKVKQRVKTDKLSEVSQIREALKEEMVSLLSVPSSKSSTSCHSERSGESPQVILVVGVNGSGKTTSIAKLAYDLTSQGKRVILAAADTFRAAAIEQLEHWGEKVGAEVIAHQPGGDPGAVAYDAVQAGYSRHTQAVIIDTAGRLHTKFNLMEELKKIKRVVAKNDASAPHQVLLVMDATTGQNGLAQAKHFTEAVDVTDIFLAKLDGTARGGIIFAICNQLNIPISYIGTGEKLQDMAPFDAEVFVNAIFS
ncbi:MAG: signal recognition particle-docking protein FtsY [Dehalococcoidia bacterium]|nr:signal recognition particle-docking protein FtsY [Dehalococcoidia bacterium]MDH4292187.1 signal recognition particle-docking protein FtsY [Dehalococcoidia bacterium]